MPDNGNDWRKFRAVPRSYPLRSLSSALLRLIGLETKNVLDYQGRAGDYFHCTVERSPGHIRCRFFCWLGHQLLPRSRDISPYPPPPRRKLVYAKILRSHVWIAATTLRNQLRNTKIAEKKNSRELRNMLRNSTWKRPWSRQPPIT